MGILANHKQVFDERQKLHDYDKLISDRAYNLTIGLVLTWGFALNYITTTFFSAQVMKINFILIILGYVVCAILGACLTSSKSYIVSFIGYNLIAVPVGIVLTRCIAEAGYDSSIVVQAVMITGFVTVVMMLLGVLFPNFFLSVGRVLFVALLSCIVVDLILTLIFHNSFTVFDWIIAGVFSMYIGYDWARANRCQKTLDNAVDISTSLYLDIINLFLRVLSLLGKNKK